MLTSKESIAFDKSDILSANMEGSTFVFGIESNLCFDIMAAAVLLLKSERSDSIEVADTPFWGARCGRDAVAVDV